jgi:hypothetical protein
MEIEELLRNDTSRIGEIFNHLAQGHDAEVTTKNGGIPACGAP